MRIFSLRDSEFEIRPIHHLELEWAGVANQELARQIGFQIQFSQFFRHLLENLQSAPVEHPDWQPVPLSLSLRAGAIRTFVLLTVSIAEAALAALGEERGLGRKPNEIFDRTFGQLLNAWRHEGQPRPEIAEIWDNLQLLKDVRNYIHLPKAAGNDAAHWREILAREQEIVAACEAVTDRLRDLSHVFRD